MPLLLEYFVPGFIFMKVFNFLISKKSGSNLVLGSVVISYLMKAVSSSSHRFVFSKSVFSWDERVVILSVFAVVLSVICVAIFESKSARNLSLNINNKTLHDDIWNDIINYKDGTSLRVVCDDSVYTGILVCHEEKGTDSWFVIKDYIVEEPNRKYTSKKFTFKARLAINMKNVKRVELYYGEHIPTFIEKSIHKFENVFKRNK